MVSVKSTYSANTQTIKLQTEQTVGEEKTAPIVVPVGQTTEPEQEQNYQQTETTPIQTSAYNFTFQIDALINNFTIRPTKVFRIWL